MWIRAKAQVVRIGRKIRHLEISAKKINWTCAEGDDSMSVLKYSTDTRIQKEMRFSEVGDDEVQKCGDECPGRAVMGTQIQEEIVQQ